jgi:tetratricopeptide (TPR) repeat protein
VAPEVGERLIEAFATQYSRLDTTAALDQLRREWPPALLAQMLTSDSPDVVRTAATCLGFLGSDAHSARLARLLAHQDARVADAAEHALWSVWMRSRDGRANRELQSAVSEIGRERYASAVEILQALTLMHPTFAEAFHQLGIALCFLDRLDEAEAAYRNAVRLNPWHFAAWAALGHVAVQRGDLPRALRNYRRAVSIHPRLHEIRAVLPELEAAVRARSVA